MTSNGNTAQKILIENLIKYNSQAIDTAKAFLKSIEEAQNGEQMEIIQRIAKKFNIEL